MSAAIAAPAVIAKFSRLLVDANRPLDSPTLFRDTADGQPIHFNRGKNLSARAYPRDSHTFLILPPDLSEEEKEKRLERCYYPYHKAVSDVQRQVMPDFILSLHSYTDNYEGQVPLLDLACSKRPQGLIPLLLQKRVVEVGVLYDEDEDLAKKMKEQFIEQGTVLALGSLRQCSLSDRA